MPMETSAVGIRPVNRPAAPGGVDGVGRRGGESASAGFRPQTNVSIENAIEDMAGILSKISTAEMENVEKMPADLQKVIENVMKQAFSFDETLGSGLGSTMESQRFSMEQLTSVARTLLQMGALAEKGYDVNISDGLQSLLTNLKAAVTQEPGGQAFEPVLLLKAAFGLINGKEMESLPQALQQIIASMQSGGGQGMTQQPTETMAFLQKLVQYFMPRGADAAMLNAAQQAVQGQGQSAQQTAQGTMPQAMAGGQAAAEGQAANGQTALPGGAGTASQAQTAAGAQNGQALPNGQSALQGQPTAQGQAAEWMQGQAASQDVVQGQAQGQPAAMQGQPVEGQAAPQGQAAGTAASQTGAQPAQGQGAANTANTANATGQANANATTLPNGANASNPANTTNTANAANDQAAPNPANSSEGNAASQAQQAGADFGRADTQQQAAQAARQGTQPTVQDPASTMTMTAREAKEFLMSQPLQNTQEAMQTMKQLARAFLARGEISPADAQALQSFADSGNAALPPKEARQLETLLRVVQQNIPATIQQAAVQQNIPELPRLWAFMQLSDLAVTKRLSGRQLKKAAKDIAEFIFSMRGSMEGEHAVQQGQRSMNFMMPMYLGENEKSYPAYIHVYDETQEDKETGIPKKETWLRLCVLTENLGAVELTCRVYEHEHLDMRIIFANQEASQEFRSYVPELRRSMRGSKLKLEDVAIGAPGV